MADLLSLNSSTGGSETYDPGPTQGAVRVSASPCRVTVRGYRKTLFIVGADNRRGPRGPSVAS